MKLARLLMMRLIRSVPANNVMHETDTRHLSDRIFTSERVSRYLPTQQYNTNIGTHTHSGGTPLHCQQINLNLFNV